MRHGTGVAVPEQVLVVGVCSDGSVRVRCSQLERERGKGGEVGGSLCDLSVCPFSARSAAASVGFSGKVSVGGCW